MRTQRKKRNANKSKRAPSKNQKENDAADDEPIQYGIDVFCVV